GAGRAGAAARLLVGAAGGHAAVGAAVRVAGCAAHGPRRPPVITGPRGRAPRRLRNAEAVARLLRGRALFGCAVVLLWRLGLAGWYFKLQVIDHDAYAMRSEANRIKPRPVVPGRGLILDREGRILADNVPAYRLDVTPEEAGDPQALVEALSEVVDLSPEDMERFEAARRTTRGFRAIPLKLRISDDEAARFAVERWRFPGVELVPYLNRRYPYADLLA